LFVPIGRDWEDFTVHIERLHDAGDYVVMQGRITGTYKPTGKRLDAQTCDILRYRDGKLVRFQQYYDTAQLQRVMN
jgi:ketosteroid isomerase-like protein